MCPNQLSLWDLTSGSFISTTNSLRNTVSVHLSFHVWFSFSVISSFFRLNSPQWARTFSFARFLDHTQRRTVVGRTPLDEWSARHRDLYLKTHNTHNKHLCPGGIQSHNLSRRAAADLRHRPRGRWERYARFTSGNSQATKRLLREFSSGVEANTACFPRTASRHGNNYVQEELSPLLTVYNSMQRISNNKGEIYIFSNYRVSWQLRGSTGTEWLSFT
jgi:hypothetical protein